MITKKVGDLAYELLLPPHLKVHNVFHVSLLKKYVPSPNHVLEDEILTSSTQGQMELQPEEILGVREKILRNRILKELLVKWKFYPFEDATWENEADLLRDYPQFVR
ncbi:hypothetical protein [Escherichia coli]|uniref:hypothetical protein n=1 Tax=Escherichia coli TaxID=562 RepID=UPI00257876E4|nr:hypothetical protein [Escherichia coli]MDM1593401.1 hypothetical protein [Escherichia coli]